MCGIAIAACSRFGGQLRIVAGIEEAGVIAKILAHLERVAPGAVLGRVAAWRARAAVAGPPALNPTVREVLAGR